MQRKTLGTSDLDISRVCLGTMTFGNQTDEADAHRQIDMALAAGIDFLDTAEMYPVNPVRAETVGRTEEIIGRWITATGRRDEIVLATKIAGPSEILRRDGRGIDGSTMIEAVEGSLRRLQTDVIDLYQLHWPNRGYYHFRQHWTYTPDATPKVEIDANMVEVLDAMRRLRDQGKVRAFGLSNESAWGVSEWLRLARATGAPEMVSIQNEYSLMCRMFDTDLAETCLREGVDLLAYSPLATGLLTGKYRNGAVPEGSRMALSPQLGGRIGPRADAAVEAYIGLAQRHGLDPVHLSLAFCQARPFMGAVIIGATSAAQLEHILAGSDLSLSGEVLKEINETYRAHPLPF